MALGRDPSIEFAKSLVDRFVQFKSLQFQQDLLKRKEQRYDTQLQENRLHRQRQLTRSDAYLGLAERRTIATEQGKLGTNINVPVFSPGQMGGSSQTPGVDTIIKQELDLIEVDKSGRKLFTRASKERGDRINQSAIDKARSNAMSRLGLQHLGPGKTEQFEYSFNRQLNEKIGGLRNAEIIQDVTQDMSIDQLFQFQGAQSSEPKGRPAGFLGRSESEFPAGFETPKGLESIWKQLSEEEKTTARTYIKGGGSPQAIIDIFESSKQLE